VTYGHRDCTCWTSHKCSNTGNIRLKASACPFMRGYEGMRPRCQRSLPCQGQCSSSPCDNSTSASILKPLENERQILCRTVTLMSHVVRPSIMLRVRLDFMHLLSVMLSPTSPLSINDIFMSTNCCKFEDRTAAIAQSVWYWLGVGRQPMGLISTSGKSAIYTSPYSLYRLYASPSDL
jgi:hypothetical protein